jgi:hypothetical protein
MTKPFPLVLAACVSVAACGDSAPEQTPPPSSPANAAPPAPTVTIVSPADGAFQEEREVEVLLNSTVTIVPAGDMTAGTGHHHLYLDVDLGDMNAPIPTVPGSIVHLGDGSRAYRFENLTSGPHRIIAVVADGAHVALRPLVVDTVEFVVE